jgi:hypothetical protein
MSAVVNCPTCHHAIPPSGLAFCAACGAPLATGDGRQGKPPLNALETWTGWNGLVVSQQAAMSYWFMARRDYAHLRQLVDGWNAPDDPVRRLLVAKLDRALVSDPDQFPADAVSIGAQFQYRVRGNVSRGVLVDPAQQAHRADGISVLSPLGALLLGMIEGRALRGGDFDGAALTLVVEKVEQPGASTAVAANDSAKRKLAS